MVLFHDTRKQRAGRFNDDLDYNFAIAASGGGGVGPEGPEGPAGPPGADGADGPPGADGTNGTNGLDGARWFSGNGNPSSSIGATGDYYLDGATGNVWVRTGSQWFPSGENIMGPAGADGADLIPLDNTWTGTQTYSLPASGTAGLKVYSDAPTGNAAVYQNGDNLFLGANGTGTVSFNSACAMGPSGFLSIGPGTFFGAVAAGAGLTVTGSPVLSPGAGTNSFRAGTNAGVTTQGSNTVAVGRAAGNATQGNNSVAVGTSAGQTTQGASAVSIGNAAGKTTQGSNAVAVGREAGTDAQGTYAIALGSTSGRTNQGSNSIAIGRNAGYANQADNGIIISSNGSQVNNTTVGHIFLKSTTNELKGTGGNWVHSGTMTSSSDKRLKKDIEPIVNALSKVQKLNGVTFQYTDENIKNRATGLIAQDVREVLPEAVLENEEGYLALGYGNMVGLLVESIKELTARIETLEKQLEM